MPSFRLVERPSRSTTQSRAVKSVSTRGRRRVQVDAGVAEQDDVAFERLGRVDENAFRRPRTAPGRPGPSGRSPRRSTSGRRGSCSASAGRRGRRRPARQPGGSVDRVPSPYAEFALPPECRKYETSADVVGGQPSRSRQFSPRTKTRPGASKTPVISPFSTSSKKRTCHSSISFAPTSCRARSPIARHGECCHGPMSSFCRGAGMPRKFATVPAWKMSYQPPVWSAGTVILEKSVSIAVAPPVVVEARVLEPVAEIGRVDVEQRQEVPERQLPVEGRCRAERAEQSCVRSVVSPAPRRYRPRGSSPSRSSTRARRRLPRRSSRRRTART